MRLETIGEMRDDPLVLVHGPKQAKRLPHVLTLEDLCSLLVRKANEAGVPDLRQAECAVTAPEELALARHLLNFGLVLEAVAAEYRPNFLCNYLYDLAGHFSRFSENCPVLKAEGTARISRLALCELTGRVLQQGLHLLGLETVEQM